MEYNDLTLKQHSQTDWHLLGQSGLSIDATSRNLSHSWLLRVLVPISLPTDLVNRIKLSLDETMAHSSLASGIEVRIFISTDVQAADTLNKNWGYFKLEKIGASGATDQNVDHIVEYYLYLEK